MFVFHLTKNYSKKIITQKFVHLFDFHTAIFLISAPLFFYSKSKPAAQESSQVAAPHVHLCVRREAAAAVIASQPRLSYKFSFVTQRVTPRRRYVSHTERGKRRGGGRSGGWNSPCVTFPSKKRFGEPSAGKHLIICFEV